MVKNNIKKAYKPDSSFHMRNFVGNTYNNYLKGMIAKKVEPLTEKDWDEYCQSVWERK